MIVELPLVTAAEIAAECRADGEATVKATLRRLRERELISAGVAEHPRGAAGRVAGAWHVYSALNLDPVRAAHAHDERFEWAWWLDEELRKRSSPSSPGRWLGATGSCTIRLPRLALAAAIHGELADLMLGGAEGPVSIPIPDLEVLDSAFVGRRWRCGSSASGTGRRC